MAKAQTPPVKQWELNLPSTLSLSTNSDDWFYQVIQTSDGGYLGAGYARVDLGQGYLTQNNATLVKFDALGNLVWEVLYYLSITNYRGYFTDATEVADGYIAVGQFRQSSILSSDIELFKVDKSNGAILSGFPKVFGVNELTQLACEASLSSIKGTFGRPSIREVKTNNGSDGFIMSMIGEGLTSASEIKDFALLVRLNNSFSLNTSFGQYGYKVFGNDCPAYPCPGSNCTLANSSAENVRVIYDSNGNPTGFLMVGQYNYTKDPGGPFEMVLNAPDALVVNVNLDGTIKWQKQFSEVYFSGNGITYNDDDTDDESACDETDHNTDAELAYDLEQISPTQFLIACQFDMFVSEFGCTYGGLELSAERNRDAVLLKINESNGSIDWAKNVAFFRGPDFFTPLSVLTDEYFLAGNDLDNTKGALPEVVKVASDGSVVYDKVYALPTSPNDQKEFCVFGLATTTDGGLILGGNSGYTINLVFNENYNLMKLSSDCQLNPTNPYNLSGLIEIGSIGYPSPYTISSNQKVSGKIVVKPGAVLNINNGCTVQFTDSRQMYSYIDLAASTDNRIGIVVQKGGTLNVTGGATTKGMFSCNKQWTWDGITVEGDPALAQNTTNQGYMNIDGNSVILNARIGTVAGKTSFDVGTTQYISGGNLFKTDFNVPLGKGGGVITATSATWRNCWKDVVFSKYNSQSIKNISTFYQCSFICDNVLVDPNYLINSTDKFTMGKRAGTLNFVDITNAHGISFTGNTWTNSVGTALLPNGATFRGIGIKSVDGDFKVTRNCFATDANGCCIANQWDVSSFNNLSYGIDASVTGAAALQYDLNIYLNNFNSCYRGILASAIKQPLLQITRNTFTILASPANAYGVDMEGCTGWLYVEDNTFTGVSANNNFGLVVSNSGISDNKIRRNTFSNLYKANVALQKNATGNGVNGLQMLCGTFTNNVYDIEIGSYLLNDPTPSAGKVRKNQGTCGTDESPANNIFNDGANCTGDQSISLDANTVYTPNNKLNYRRHSTGENWKPNCIGPFVFDDNCGDFSFFAAACTSSFACLAGPLRLGSDSVMLSDINLQLAELYSQQSANDTSESLIEQVADLQAQRIAVINKMLADDMNEGNVANAIEWLTAENEMRIIIPLMIAIGKFDDALSTLSSFPADSLDDQQFIQLQTILINLGKNEMTIYDIDSSQQSIIREIATTRTESSYNARNILEEVFKEHYAEDIPSENDFVKYQQSDEISLINSTILNVYPNPSSDIVTISYYKSFGKSVYLILSDLIGKEYGRIHLTDDARNIEIDISKLQSGIYLFSLFDGSNTTSYRKIEVIR